MKLNKITAALSGGVLLLAGANAQAAVISFTDTIVSTTTNWGPTALTVDQFDSSWGTLTQVDIFFDVNVDGTANAESLDAAPASVTLNIFANIGLDLTSLSVGDFLFVNVGDSTTEALGAYDGLNDFAGISGVGPISLGGSDSDSRSTMDAVDLAFFTGLGSISFDSSATGTSSGNGAGNLITQFATNAGASLRVEYTFDAATSPPVTVPEPGSLLLMGLGLIGLAGISRRKLKA